MKQDPFLFTYNHWKSSLNPNLTRHHTIPRSRPNLLGEAQSACRLPRHDQSWNLVTVPSDIHALWHFLFNRFAPWEVLCVIGQKGYAPDFSNWETMAWLVIFANFTPRRAAQAMAQQDRGSLVEICFKIVHPDEVGGLVLKSWTPPPLRDYTLDLALKT